jgi:membrane-bound lytic murein transglycosylase MltF
VSRDLDQILAEFTALKEAVRHVESRGRKDVVSKKGAVGDMQTMPATLRDPGYGVVPARDDSDDERTRVGEDYLLAMTKKFPTLDEALAAYNWGPGKVRRHGIEAAPPGTNRYIADVKARMPPMAEGAFAPMLAQEMGDTRPMTSNPNIMRQGEKIRERRFQSGIKAPPWYEELLKSMQGAR